MRKCSVKAITICMAAVLCMTMFSASGLTTMSVQAAQKTAKVTINRKKAVLTVGEKLKLKIKGTKAKIKWSSSNKKVATVSKKGVVTAKKKGNTIIKATIKNKKLKKNKLKCRIRVKAKPLYYDANKINGSTLMQGIYFVDKLYDGDNIIFSPLSLNYVLAMAANGGGDRVRSGIETYLGKSIDRYNKYCQEFLKRTETNTLLNIANSVWYKDLYTMNTQYENRMKQYYNAQITKAPFDMNTVNNINQWAKDNTDGMIDHIMDIQDLHPDAKLILVNALLFDGQWTVPFSSNATKKQKFTLNNKKIIDVDMMHGTGCAYYENEYATGFEKSYGENGDYSFIAILPKKSGDFNVADLDIQGFLKTYTTIYTVNIRMPKFEYQWDEDIKNVIQTTKAKSVFNTLTQVFDSGSNGKNVTESMDMIKQFCRIQVGEEGTKAAAVTVTYKSFTSVMPSKEVKTVTLDRPFAYIIRDNVSGEVLFVGKVTKP